MDGGCMGWMVLWVYEKDVIRYCDYQLGLRCGFIAIGILRLEWMNYSKDVCGDGYPGKT